MKVLVTGATGYIGGRLIPRLLDAGHEVRVLVRDTDRIAGRSWTDRIEPVEGNVLDMPSIDRAIEGVDAAYYLVHSMCAGRNFAERDRAAAHAFASVVGGRLKQVIYLGGILPERGFLSAPKHLRSRAEVGEILRGRIDAAVTALRAGPIIGSGSASFEMVRYLTERMPVMIAPRWVHTRIHPIAVRNVLEYLVAVLGREDAAGVIDIGGDVLTFREMMFHYARLRGLPRVVLPVPVRAPGLSGRWVGIVTPLPNCLAVPLVRGMVHPVVGDTTRALELFPEIQPMGYGAAVSLALGQVDRENVKTHWSDAMGRDRPFVLEEREGLAREVRTRLVDAPPEAVFRAFTSLGGERGWLVWRWAWALRGFVDQIVGGPGLRRGRRDPDDLRVGEAVDFWRVEELRPARLLRLRAEMKVPGRAWLQFEARSENGGTRLIQAALFEPKGFWGWVYWYAMYPAHAFIFDRMIDALAKLATEMMSEEEAGAG